MALVLAGHILDANAVGLWRMDDASANDLVEENGDYSATGSGGAPVIVTGQIDDARAYPGSSAKVTAPTDAAVRNLVAGFAWTLEFWLQIDAFTGGVNAVFGISKPDGTLSIFDLSWWSVSHKLLLGTAANGNFTIGPDLTLGAFFHVAVRKKDGPGSTALWDLFINGVEVVHEQSTSDAVDSPTSDMLLTWGFNGTAGAGTYGVSRQDDMRLSNVLRTDAEILESYQRGTIGIPEATILNAYSRGLAQLLPRGVLWLLEGESWIQRTLVAIGDELQRVVARGVDLIDESDPRNADETLSEWETMLGLPDEEITEIPGTTAGRRLAITQKLIRQGAPTIDFYTALAAACGYEVTIDDEFGGDLFRSGVGRSGDGLGDSGAPFRWELTVSTPVGTALTHAQLEAVFNSAKPAHTTVTFTYL